MLYLASATGCFSNAQGRRRENGQADQGSPEAVVWIAQDILSAEVKTYRLTNCVKNLVK